MSKYRTPFVVGYSSINKIAKSMDKYRLPFRKDEPTQERSFALSKIQNQMKITSQLLLDKQFNASSQRQLSQSQVETDKTTNRLMRRSVGNNPIDSNHTQIHKNNFPLILNESQLTKKESVSSGDKQQATQLKIYERNKNRLNNRKNALSLNQNRNKNYNSSKRYQQDSSQPQSQNQHYQVEAKNQDFAMIELGGQNQEEQEQKQKEVEEIITELTRNIEMLKNKQVQHHIGKIKNRSQLQLQSTKKHRIKLNDCQVDAITKLHQQQSNLPSRNNLHYHLTHKIKDKKQYSLIKINKKQLQQHPMQNQNQQITQKYKKITKINKKVPLQFYITSYERIKNINPFFRKVTELGGCILLSLGKLWIADAAQKIYSQGQAINHIYIIIYGKIILTDRHKLIKKYALTGESLSEEQLFQGPKSYKQRFEEGSLTSYHKEDAKAISKSCLLKIKTGKYYKMYTELHKMGYKQLFHLIDNLFRINYIHKQTYHRDQPQRIHTEKEIKKKKSVPSFAH